jgi:hypothetical protein
MLHAHERLEKAKVRLRDKVCRFPVCGCQNPRTSAMKALPTCSHDVHKGLGGDPTGKRSVAAVILLLCKWRHQDAPVSRHAGTMKTEYLTPSQNDGPLAFLVDLSALRPSSDPRQLPKGMWFEVARESAPGELEALTVEQHGILGQLAEMHR